MSELTKQDIEGFHKVAKLLNKSSGLYQFGGMDINKVSIMHLHYIDIGEGMAYEVMEDYELTQLIETLHKRFVE